MLARPTPTAPRVRMQLTERVGEGPRATWQQSESLSLRQPPRERDGWTDPLRCPECLHACLLSWLQAPEMTHILALQLEGCPPIGREPQPTSSARVVSGAGRRRRLE